MYQLIAVLGSALASCEHAYRDGDEPLINGWGFIAMFLFLVLVSAVSKANKASRKKQSELEK